MALSGQRQVVDELDVLGGRGMRKAEKRYRKAIVDPIVAAIGGAKSAAGALRALGPMLVKRMDAAAIAEPLHETLDAAAGIGAAVAAPREKESKN